MSKNRKDRRNMGSSVATIDRPEDASAATADAAEETTTSTKDTTNAAAATDQVVEDPPADAPETDEPGSEPADEAEVETPDEPVSDQVNKLVEAAKTVTEVAAALAIDDKAEPPVPDEAVEKPEGEVAAEQTPAEPPVEQPPAVNDDAKPTEQPAEQNAADQTEGEPPAENDAMAMIAHLQKEIADLKAKNGGRRVASGSRARPNVKYKLLTKPPSWHSTPQVAQLQQILFSQPKTELSEPELFALIEAGKEKGVLRTRQNPVRIFQYYRSDLLNSNCLRWE